MGTLSLSEHIFKDSLKTHWSVCN